MQKRHAGLVGSPADHSDFICRAYTGLKLADADVVVCCIVFIKLQTKETARASLQRYERYVERV